MVLTFNRVIPGLENITKAILDDKDKEHVLETWDIIRVISYRVVEEDSMLINTMRPFCDSPVNLNYRPDMEYASSLTN